MHQEVIAQMILTPARTRSYLQHFPAQNGPAHRINLEPLPFRIGRDKKTHYAIASKQISKEHAEIDCSGDHFVIRDLGSTNGTYVNGQRVQECPLKNGDIVHVAHEEFRFLQSFENIADANKSDLLFTDEVEGKVPASVIYGRQCLQEMIGQRSVQILFQPIVHLDSQELFGFESLARGTHANLSIKPGELFGLAERCGLAPSLSQMFRQKAIDEGARLIGTGFLFLNLHPAEMGDDQLISSLRDLAGPTNWRLVLEINENAAEDLSALQKFHQQVKDMGMLVAYDDFGAGQARFLELAEVPPDFIKLDMRLIRNIHKSASRQKLIRGIVQSGQDQRVQVIAEGVESDAEAQVCQELGCNFGQGFYFGHPQPFAQLSAIGKISPGDRRASARLPGWGIILIRPQEDSGKPLARSGKIVDLSKTGIGLLVNYQFSKGTILSLAPIGWNVVSPPAVKVIHCKEVDGQWLHGCQFVQKLNRKDLEHFFSFNLKRS